jgi:hypothetical protein
MLSLSHMSWLRQKGGDIQAKTSLLDRYHPFLFSIVRLRLSWLWALWYFGCTSTGLGCGQSFPGGHGKYARAWRVRQAPQLRKSFRKIEVEGGSVANRAKKPRNIRSQDEGPRLVQWRWNLTGFFAHRLLQCGGAPYSTRSVSWVFLHPPIIPTVSASVHFGSFDTG